MSVSGDGGRFPATSPGVERVLVWAFLGIRAFDLAQAAVALAAGSLRKSSDPTLDIALMITLTAESVLLGRWLLRRGFMVPSGWTVAADFGMAAAVVASAPAYISAAGR